MQLGHQLNFHGEQSLGEPHAVPVVTSRGSKLHDLWTASCTYEVSEFEILPGLGFKRYKTKTFDSELPAVVADWFLG